MITIENLHKHYGSHHVLKGISITFQQGRVYGIVGENGAGKSTLFRCMAGLEKFSGSIAPDTENRKKFMGFLQTEPWFFNLITGREYIRLLCHARGIREVDVAERNIFYLPLNQYASTYSTGMKKKLALTAILFQENEVYILDEPFNGVDIQSNILIAGIIHKLRELNKTVIISSHIFSTLADTSDEIHLLRDGNFVRTVEKPDFGKLEQEMQEITLGNKIEKLGLK
jgi:ABC-2 type transport system ATP-binding protein